MSWIVDNRSNDRLIVHKLSRVSNPSNNGRNRVTKSSHAGGASGAFWDDSNVGSKAVAEVSRRRELRWHLFGQRPSIGGCSGAGAASRFGSRLRLGATRSRGGRCGNICGWQEPFTRACVGLRVRPEVAVTSDRVALFFGRLAPIAEPVIESGSIQLGARSVSGHIGS